MALYDGNQLPESPTSKFQMVVSVVYTLLVFLLMSYGATAVLAAQETISTELQATQYMKRLVRKHNAVVRGMIAFIPATFSLGHLYTSSMHNGSLYTASNVFYVAIFAFATSYLGNALQQVGADSGHMDATKAVYETLYFLTGCCAHLSAGPKPLLQCMKDKDGYRNTFASKAWRSSWVKYNCFLSIAALDDSRLWRQFIAWCRRHRKPSALDFVPPHTSNSYKNIVYRVLASVGWYPTGCTGYAYWLFSQDVHVYNYTGSVIVEQAIPEKLSIASYSTREMYPAAQSFMSEFSTYFQKALEGTNIQSMEFSISAGNATVNFSSLRECLTRVRFENQGLNMAVERYICRYTPDYAALYLSASEVNRVVGDICKWAAVLYNSRCGAAPHIACMQHNCRCHPPIATLAGPRLHCLACHCDDVAEVERVLIGLDGSFYRTLWLAYMHMVLLGVDLLRMHNNKATFAEYKQQQAGFFEILAPQTPRPIISNRSSRQCDRGASGIAASLTIKAASDGNVTAVWKPPEQLAYPELHNLSVDDQHSMAAILATLLLVQEMHNMKTLGQNSCKTVAEKVTIKWEPWASDHPSEKAAYLRKRSELITERSSLPEIVQGVECRAASNWVRSLLLPLGLINSCVAVVAITFATIACSNGVFLVAISGLVQAYFAWALLMQMEQVPCVKEVNTHPCLDQLLQLALGLICPVICTLELLWELLLQGCCCCCCCFQWLRQPLRQLQLSSNFNEACRRLFKHRISLSDWLVHVSTLTMGLLFAIFVALAVTQEDYYATGMGMCLGRCNSRPDCWNNITLKLPNFDGPGIPSCPGEGRVVDASNLLYHQCPAVRMVLIVSNISMTTDTVTPGTSASNTLEVSSELAGSQHGAASPAPVGQRHNNTISSSTTVQLPAVTLINRSFLMDSDKFLTQGRQTSDVMPHQK